MYIFINLIFLFIFVFVLLMINIPQIQHDENIKFKLYIFVGIFIFEFIFQLITIIYKSCVIDIGKIAKNSLQSALIAVIGYSIYTDLILSSSPIIPNQDSDKMKNFTITVLITVFIALGYFIDIAFTNTIPGVNDCLNKIYVGK